ncbi:hypothetical protein SEA_HEATHER_45 [Streptomyces phage Heather]|uniref:Lipoprotein n=1 Tax=Streptomyces phage Heather TaxID=2562343 RepID=A0A4D6E5L9_9CAUD|nr:hypothetical protein SEA_HEATHER_45 [Streptomyces phage Heather]
MNRRAVATSLAGLALVGSVSLTACDPGPECVESHLETQWQPIFNGKTTTLHPVMISVCDRYAEPKESKSGT